MTATVSEQRNLFAGPGLVRFTIDICDRCRRLCFVRPPLIVCWACATTPRKLRFGARGKAP